ncbi:MAG: hypothetical protein HYR49_10095 [Gammaproteobacteria bacterium]|nr:hypothetical protein [Gammaproteobacteria bacterium]
MVSPVVDRHSITRLRKLISCASIHLTEIVLKTPMTLDFCRTVQEAVDSVNWRTLLIHEYRRILLHDTDLPDELLPADWPGREAFDLTATLYRQVQQGAVQYLRREMQSLNGSLPAPNREYYGRFGGLPSFDSQLSG